MTREFEWFRPPMLKQCCSMGDTENWLWIAEPICGDGVYGVAYKIAMNVVVDDEVQKLMFHAEARRELDRRIARGEKRGEGQHFDVFAWSPIVRRRGNFLIFDEKEMA